MSDPSSDQDQSREQIRSALFGHSVDAQNYPSGDYQAHLLDQYNLTVELADRTSQRRGIANTFFSTLNLAFFSGLANVENYGYFATMLLPLVGVVINVVWVLLIRSYAQLNEAKFKVVGVMEEIFSKIQPDP